MGETLSCRKFVEFLDEYLTNDLPPAQRDTFNEHLAACPSCVVYMKTYQESIRLGRRALRETDEALPRGVPEQLVQGILAARRKG